MKNSFISLFSKTIAIVAISIFSFFIIMQTVPTIAADSPPPAEADKALEKRQTTAIEKALDSVFALPTTIFPSCNVTAVTTNKQLSNLTGDALQNKKKELAQQNSKKFINCLKDIVNIVFLVAVIWVIVDIATSNLGLISRSGAPGGSGDNPVANARAKLEKALIGLILIGGISLILNLFSSNILKFDLVPLDPLISVQQTQVAAVLPDMQSQQEATNANGTQRSDIKDIRSDELFLPYSTQDIGVWIEQYLSNKGVTLPQGVSGNSFVFASRGSNQAGSRAVVPIEYMVAYPAVVSRWGNTNLTPPPEQFVCAFEKKNMYLVPLNRTQQDLNPTIKEKRKKSQPLTGCDFAQTYQTWNTGINEFVSYYTANLSKYKDCAIWENYNPTQASTICAKVKLASEDFLSFVRTKVALPTPSRT